MLGQKIVMVPSAAAAQQYLAANADIKACIVYNEPASLSTTGQSNGGQMYVQGGAGPLNAGVYYGDRNVQYRRADV